HRGRHQGRGPPGQAVLPAGPGRAGGQDQGEAGSPLTEQAVEERQPGKPAPAPKAEREAGRKGERKPSFLRELVVLVVSALLIAVGVKAFVAQAFYIPSGSMLPQLQVGDRIVVSKVSYHLHDPHRGDIVVFDSPNPKPPDSATAVEKVLRGLGQAIGVGAPSTDEFVKRVMGLPGETVEGRL